MCLGAEALVQERVGSFLTGLVSRRSEFKRCCRTILRSGAEGSCGTPTLIPNAWQMHIPP